MKTLYGRLPDDKEWTKISDCPMDFYLKHYAEMGFKTKVVSGIGMIINPMSKKIEAQFKEVA